MDDTRLPDEEVPARFQILLLNSRLNFGALFYILLSHKRQVRLPKLKVLQHILGQ